MKEAGITHSTSTQWLSKYAGWAVVAVVALGVKLCYEACSVEQLRFLLAPTAWLVQLFTGSQSDFIAQEGYLFPALNMIISKSCAGVNLCIIYFFMISYMVLRSRVLCSKWLYLMPILMADAYLFTIMVNAMRILCALWVAALPLSILQQYPAATHLTVGVVVNVTTLIVSYTLIHHLISRYEKDS